MAKPIVERRALYKQYGDAVTKLWLGGKLDPEIANELNIDVSIVTGVRKKFGLVKGKDELKEEYEFIRKMYFYGMTDAEIAEDYKDYFGSERTAEAIKAIRGRTGLTMKTTKCKPRVMHRLAPLFRCGDSFTGLGLALKVDRSTVARYAKLHAELMKKPL